MKRVKQVLLLSVYLFFLLLNVAIARPMKLAMQVSTKQQLLNRVIVIDAGHGGRDDGAKVAPAKEDELNLKVSFALKKIIEQAGGNVVMIRSEDNDLSSRDASNHKKEDLANRVEIMDQENVDIFISIHMNKFSSTNVSGGQVFYQVNHPLSAMLADAVQKEFKEQLESRKLARIGNFYILNNTKTTGILVECGFMSNASELALLQQEDYQTKVAYAIYSGIVSYFQHVILM